MLLHPVNIAAHRRLCHIQTSGNLARRKRATFGHDDDDVHLPSRDPERTEGVVVDTGVGFFFSGLMARKVVMDLFLGVSEVIS